MKVELELSLKDLIVFILILCLLTLGVFLYKRVEINRKNISTIAIATGLVKPQPVQKPLEGGNDGK